MSVSGTFVRIVDEFFRLMIDVVIAYVNARVGNKSWVFGVILRSYSH